MIKKQVDWAVRIQSYGAPGGFDPSLQMKAEYPASDGWELVSTNIAQTGPEGAKVVMLFAKYEYESEAVAYEPVSELVSHTEAPRRRGRPPKVAEEVAG